MEDYECPGDRTYILQESMVSGLVLHDMKLSEAETRGMVTAMRDRVESVSLYDVTLDNLDIEELTKYDGQGRCNELGVFKDTRRRYRDRLRGWAADKGWTLTEDNDVRGLVMKR